MGKKVTCEIDGDLIERIINLMEKVEEKKEERDNYKINLFNENLKFIKSQLNVLEEEITKVDIYSEQYVKLMKIYDQVINIVKYWW